MGLEPRQTGLGAGQRLVLTANPTLIADAVQVIEQKAVVDFAGARFVATRVIGQLDRAAFPQEFAAWSALNKLYADTLAAP